MRQAEYLLKIRGKGIIYIDAHSVKKEADSCYGSLEDISDPVEHYYNSFRANIKLYEDETASWTAVSAARVDRYRDMHLSTDIYFNDNPIGLLSIHIGSNGARIRAHTWDAMVDYLNGPLIKLDRDGNPIDDVGSIVDALEKQPINGLEQEIVSPPPKALKESGFFSIFKSATPLPTDKQKNAQEMGIPLKLF